jgi:hypothetical protein
VRFPHATRLLHIDNLPGFATDAFETTKSKFVPQTEDKQVGKPALKGQRQNSGGQRSVESAVWHINQSVGEIHGHSAPAKTGAEGKVTAAVAGGHQIVCISIRHGFVLQGIACPQVKPRQTGPVTLSPNSNCNTSCHGLVTIFCYPALLT